MANATSSSDRYEAARKTLATIENEPSVAEFYQKHARKMMRREGFVDGHGDHYDSAALIHNIGRLGEALTTAVDALRALIEPPATAETPEQIAMRVYRGVHDFPVLIDGDNMRDLITRGIQAGILAAWESWEPDDYAGEEK